MNAVRFVGRFLLLFGIAAALSGFWPSAGSAAIEDDAKAMVQQLADRALGILARKDIPKAERESQLHDLLVANFNVPAIGRFVVASYWRSASKQEKAEFLEVFEVYVVKTYSAQLGQYSGEKFRVLSAAPDQKGVVVTSEVVPVDREPVDLKWRIRQSKPGELKVVDVVVENISMALTQRQEFASVIQKRGGTLSGLVEALREKIADLDKQERSPKSG